MEKNIVETFQRAPHFSTAEEKHDKQNNGKKIRTTGTMLKDN